ncbi:MAG: hypothetical protein KDA24_13585 [Deltaproteobacteria bacterium]|nr:hypothetical protein [Deltaproteobacteria bacterium]
MPELAGPEEIDRLLGELLEMLRAHSEDRWVAAFERVREHVAVTRGAKDPLSTARVVRDLLHMFRGGLGPFTGWQLETDGEVDVDASAALAVTWQALRAEVAGQLGRPVPD